MRYLSTVRMRFQRLSCTRPSARSLQIDFADRGEKLILGSAKVVMVLTAGASWSFSGIMELLCCTGRDTDERISVDEIADTCAN